MSTGRVGVCAPAGFRAAAAACGLKKSGKTDLALILSDTDCTAAGVFTRSLVRAAPVLVDEQTLEANPDTIRAVIANAGIANACTGKQGLQSARDMQRNTAEALGCSADQVLVLSTGVIGVQLDMQKITSKLDDLAAEAASDGGEAAATAMMTTDTVPKFRSVSVETEKGSFSIGAAAKGSGMIHPDMATMLAVITTDAALQPALLQDMLQRAADQSFNRISVDGDTSTNDTVLILANGASGVHIEGELETTFESALNSLTAELARDIVRDGEGARKLVEIHVTGCRTEQDAHCVAETIATSMLVKTAVAGGDPNWGRIVAAAGRAGVDFNPGSASLHIHSSPSEPLLLFEAGTPADFDRELAAKIFSSKELYILLDLGEGQASTRMWTCDLTKDYVHINAEYHT